MQLKIKMIIIINLSEKRRKAPFSEQTDQSFFISIGQKYENVTNDNYF